MSSNGIDQFSGEMFRETIYLENHGILDDKRNPSRNYYDKKYGPWKYGSNKMLKAAAGVVERINGIKVGDARTLMAEDANEGLENILGEGPAYVADDLLDVSDAFNSLRRVQGEVNLPNELSDEFEKFLQIASSGKGTNMLALRVSEVVEDTQSRPEDKLSEINSVLGLVRLLKENGKLEGLDARSLSNIRRIVSMVPEMKFSDKLDLQRKSYLEDVLRDNIELALDLYPYNDEITIVDNDNPFVRIVKKSLGRTDTDLDMVLQVFPVMRSTAIESHNMNKQDPLRKDKLGYNILMMRLALAMYSSQSLWNGEIPDEVRELQMRRMSGYKRTLEDTASSCGRFEPQLRTLMSFQTS